MSTKVLNILRVYLSRPWVWLMAGLALLQAAPAVTIFYGMRLQGIVKVLPEVAAPREVLKDYREFFDVAREQRLGQVEAIDLSNSAPTIPATPFRIVPIQPTGWTIEPTDGTTPGPTFAAREEMGVLVHAPHLRYLKADACPFSVDGLRRLGELKQLKFLSLRNASASDPKTLEAASVVVPEVLGRLSELRELDLTNAFAMRVPVPALPGLTWLAIGPRLDLEKDLRQLARTSPALRTLVLTGASNLPLTEGAQDALGEFKNLRAVYLDEMPDGAALRSALASRYSGVAFPRTSYLQQRVYGSLYVGIALMFLSMINWFQALVAFGMSFSRTTPGFAPAHLGVSLVYTAGLLLVGIPLLIWLGTDPLAAVVLPLTIVSLMISPQPASDVTPSGTLVAKLVSSWRFLAIGMALVSIYLSPVTVDAFLAGEMRVVAGLALLIEIAASSWALRRLTRQACVVSERGQTNIPGLIPTTQTAWQNPILNRRGGGMALTEGWQDWGFEKVLGRSHLGLTTLLAAGNPGGFWFARGLVLLAVLSFSGMIVQRTGRQSIEAAAPFLMLQGGLIFVIWMFAQWVARRPMLCSEFLRPVTRQRLYGSLWSATAIDMGRIFLVLTIMGAGALVYRKEDGEVWSVFLLTMGALFLLVHGYLMWALTARRLWVPLICGAITIFGALPLLVIIPATLVPDQPGTRGSIWPVFVALTAGIVTGIGLEVWRKRRWMRLEFAAIG